MASPSTVMGYTVKDRLTAKKMFYFGFPPLSEGSFSGQVKFIELKKLSLKRKEERLFISYVFSRGPTEVL